MSQNRTDELLRALAHTERRRLLRRCRTRAVSAGDLAQDAGMSLASVSEHLKVLRKTGLARVEKSGKYWFYKTDMASLKAVLSTLHQEIYDEDADDQTQ